MIVQNLTEISVIDVLDRGVANSECIALSAHEDFDIGQHGLMIGVLQPNGFATPVHDHMFWFGDARINEDDWIFIFTGSGQRKQSQGVEQDASIYTLYWGKDTTLFANTNVVPVLFRVDSVDVLMPKRNELQL